MRICIIGAGITGLAAAHLLEAKHDVTVFEKAAEVGGIAKIRLIDDIPYHLVGGHCFNSKSAEVRDFVFDVMPIGNWNKFSRRANIFINRNHYSYPIEYALREIAEDDLQLAEQIISDFFKAPGVPLEETDMDAWFRQTFGNKLAEYYFLPYNKKIWGTELKDMRSSWVEGKLPIPDKRQFIRGLLGSQKDNMVHSEFYYPRDVRRVSLIKALAEKKTIRTSSPVVSLSKQDNSWTVNQSEVFDVVISTVPMNEIVNLFDTAPAEIASAAKLLKFNKITNVFWETSGTESTWTYFPEPDLLFHRCINLGNFLVPKRNFSITEALGEIPYDVMVAEGKKVPYLKKPVSYNVSEHAYVVHDSNRTESVSSIKNFLDNIGLLYAGRFAEWEYYNMDGCIESALRICKHVNSITRT